MRTIIAVPCYNEASRLDRASFLEFIRTSPDVEFVFVDDGSRDSTREVLTELAAHAPSRMSVLALERNSGKAEAVRRGILHALADQPAVVGFWDADLATPLDAVPDLLDILRSRPEIDMVFGSRVKLLGRDIRRRPLRHYLGRIFATVVSTLLRLPVYDTQCGAKLFRVTPDLAPVFADPFLSRWVFDVEILARYLRRLDRNPDSLAGRIYEFPLMQWVDVAGSKVKPFDFLKAFRDVLLIWNRYLR